MSWRFNKRDISNNRAECLFCGKDVVEEGKAFLIQQINVKPAENVVNISYTLNGQRKFLSHHGCMMKHLFQRDFPHLEVEEYFYKYLEIKRKNKEQVWALYDKVIDEGCSQEEFDSLSKIVAKKLLQEEK